MINNLQGEGKGDYVEGEGRGRGKKERKRITLCPKFLVIYLSDGIIHVQKVRTTGMLC